MDKLKPCPLCGGDAVLQRKTYATNNSTCCWAFTVRCEKCGFEPQKMKHLFEIELENSGEIKVTKDERQPAIVAWNREKDTQDDEYIRRKDAAKLLGYIFGVDVVRRLHEVPAADVAPVVHAKWVPFHSQAAGDIQYCSACEVGFCEKMDYCPHCGAKMDGGEGREAD